MQTAAQKSEAITTCFRDAFPNCEVEKLPPGTGNRRADKLFVIREENGREHDVAFTVEFLRECGSKIASLGPALSERLRGVPQGRRLWLTTTGARVCGLDESP